MSDLMQKMSQEEDWKRELGHVLFARRQLILATVVAVVVGAVAIALFWPSTYAATSSLLVLGKRAQVSAAALDPVEFKNPRVSMQDIISELEIIRSPELARRTVRQLRKEAGWTGKKLDKNIMDEAHAFLASLETVGVTDSSAIRLIFTGRSPENAERGLETLLNEYIQYRAEVFNPSGQEQFFEERMEHYRQRLIELVVRVEGEGGEMSPAFIDQIIAGDLKRLALLQQQQGELEMELAVSAYVDNKPLLTRIAMVKAAIVQIRKETNEIQAQRLTADSAFREAELISLSLETFAKRAEEAKINDSIARSRLAGDISILNRATGTATLVFPRKGTTLFLGLIVAAITGLSVGFLAEFFDHTVRRPEDVQRNTGLPVLCSFPSLDNGEQAVNQGGSVGKATLEKLKQTSGDVLVRSKSVFSRSPGNEA